MLKESDERQTSTESASPIQQPVVMNFDREKLADIYSNLERVEDGRFAVYRIVDDYGNDSGMITCMKNSEVRIYVDNFPRQKKYFSCNYPILSIGQFENDIARTGLKLVRRDS